MQGVICADLYKGELERTILHTFTRGSKLRQWINRPDAPEEIKQFKREVFDRILSLLSPQGDDDSTSEGQRNASTVPAELALLLGTTQQNIKMRARIRHDGIAYATYQTHKGNSLVMFYPQNNVSSTLHLGSIRYIFHDNGTWRCAVRQQDRVATHLSSPFTPYPDFNAELCSYNAHEPLEIVELSWLRGHYARLDVSNNLAFAIKLFKVSTLLIAFHLSLNRNPVLETVVFRNVDKNMNRMHNCEEISMVADPRSEDS